MWEGVLEARADARLSRYPPYPNGATARWPCLAEGLQCGRGRGAGWSLGPRLRFQPWQTDWGVRARELTETPSCGGLRGVYQAPDAPSSVKGFGDQPQDVCASSCSSSGQQERGGCGRPPLGTPATGFSVWAKGLRRSRGERTTVPDAWIVTTATAAAAALATLGPAPAPLAPPLLI